MKWSARIIFSVSMIMTFLSYQRSAQDELVTERKPLTTESEVAIKMHIRYPSYLLQQGDPSNIVLKTRLPPTKPSHKTTSVLGAPSPSYFTQFHLPFDDVSQFHHFPDDQVTIWASSPWPVGPVSDPATNPNRDDSGSIPLTKASFRS